MFFCFHCNCNAQQHIYRLHQLTLSYVYVQNPKTVATPVRIYTYADFAIEIRGFYRHLTETLRYHLARCSRASGLLASISRHVYQVGRKVEFTRSCPLFLANWKTTIVGPSSIHRLAWNTTADYMGFLP